MKVSEFGKTEGLRRIPQRLSLLLFGALALGCTGNVEGARDGGGPDAPNQPGPSAEGVPVVTRIARLTHTQYDNTARALLGVSTTPASSFAPDAQNGFSFDSSVDLAVDGRLAPQYRDAAEELAQQAAAEPGFAARFVSCAEGSAGCSDQLIAELGKRAFRRPLNEAERARFAALFARGAELVGSGNPFRDGVQLVLEALMQSPQFLYRAELGQNPAGGLIKLDSWEMASRLSYLLWNSTPDAALLAQAEQGKIDTDAEITAAAQRLLADPQARAVVLSFHAQAFRFAKFKKIAPDAGAYPDAPEKMAERVDQAARRFVEDVVFDGRGGIVELLSAPFAYADQELAAVYGKQVTGSGLQKLTFGPGERAGLLMQAGFLAANAYAIRTDPIHRGLFVQRDLLCHTIPDPPPGASMTPLPPTTEQIKTTRQQITLLTSQQGCEGCHNLINPSGFAFEAFDAIGRFRAMENGAPIDTTGSTTIDAQPVSFAGAAELVQLLSTSTEARACYAQKWLEYAYGRAVVEGDNAARDALAQSALPTLELLAQLTTSKAFRYRAPNSVE